jgi:hypothetical protein
MRAAAQGTRDTPHTEPGNLMINHQLGQVAYDHGAGLHISGHQFCYLLALSPKKRLDMPVILRVNSPVVQPWREGMARGGRIRRQFTVGRTLNAEGGRHTPFCPGLSSPSFSYHSRTSTDSADFLKLVSVALRVLERVTSASAEADATASVRIGSPSTRAAHSPGVIISPFLVGILCPSFCTRAGGGGNMSGGAWMCSKKVSPDVRVCS